MIRPSDFRPHNDSIAAELRISTIVRYVDERLAAGYLFVDSGRAGWLAVDIDTVAERYRQLGWRVTTGGIHTFTFELPTT